MSLVHDVGPTVGAFVASYVFVTNCFVCSLFIAFVVHVFVHRSFFSALVRTMPRDFLGIRILLQVKMDMKRRIREDRTIDEIFTGETVVKCRSKVAMVDAETGKEWTFGDVDARANQMAAYFATTGLVEGDVVALLMHNSPEYVITWLALSRIGVVSAWINTNLRDDSLLHCVNVADCRAVVVDSELQQAIGAILTGGEHGLKESTGVHVAGPVTDANLAKHNATDFAALLSEFSKLPVNYRLKTKFTDPLCYIYTSGTTGLPKAAIMKHVRYYYAASGMSAAFGVTSDDRIYVTMPIYHSAAGMLAVGAMLIRGSTLVIRKKFSASRFWIECVQYRCTVTQYIGELCRYLLATPESPAEKEHCLRLMFGNGLRPDIWNQLKERFNIPQIGEFYGSTEGNSNLVNIDGKPGAVGFFPVYPGMYRLFPVSLIKVDDDSGEIIRNSDGMCIQCRPGETGQMVGKVIKADPLFDFTGYVGSKETEKKIVRDVFSKGDIVFSSGDLLHMDELGYLFFKDRTGDTFRWKGENVSTTEVESVLHRLLALSDATVYGVQIPGCDGRAGMAAVVDETDAVDLPALADGLKQKLPAYARPVFLRVCKTVETTGTFKLKKTNLQKDGYSLAACGDDKLYYLDSKAGKYSPLTAEVEQQINDGKIRF